MNFKKLLLASLLLCSVGISSSSHHTAFADLPKNEIAKISGTFIQYQSWMMGIDEKKWGLELDAMKGAGINTIVIQWLKSDHNRFYPIHVQGNDPTEIILRYANKNGMKVYLGLQFEKTW